MNLDKIYNKAIKLIRKISIKDIDEWLKYDNLRCRDLFSELQAELKPYKNTLVISDSNDIVRLVDVIDGNDDYYWVYDTEKGIIKYSCCGGWTPLKDFYLMKIIIEY